VPRDNRDPRESQAVLDHWVHQVHPDNQVPLVLQERQDSLEIRVFPDRLEVQEPRAVRVP